MLTPERASGIQARCFSLVAAVIILLGLNTPAPGRTAAVATAAGLNTGRDHIGPGGNWHETDACSRLAPTLSLAIPCPATVQSSTIVLARPSSSPGLPSGATNNPAYNRHSDALGQSALFISAVVPSASAAMPRPWASDSPVGAGALLDLY